MLILFSSNGPPHVSFFFFFNDTATTEIYTLSLHDALPIYLVLVGRRAHPRGIEFAGWIGEVIGPGFLQALQIPRLASVFAARYGHAPLRLVPIFGRIERLLSDVVLRR